LAEFQAPKPPPARGEGNCAAKGVSNRVEGTQKERVIERWKTQGAAGVLITQKQPGAKAGALLDRSEEPKLEADFPATTFTL
jgi:hypothetical protein